MRISTTTLVRKNDVMQRGWYVRQYVLKGVRRSDKTTIAEKFYELRMCMLNNNKVEDCILMHNKEGANRAAFAKTRIGSDRIGSDRIGSDRI